MDFVEFVNIIYQKSGIRKGYYIVLTDVKYRSRYSFSLFFIPQKSQLQTQNSKSASVRKKSGQFSSKSDVSENAGKRGFRPI